MVGLTAVNLYPRRSATAGLAPTIGMAQTIDQVKQNLLHYSLWTQVEVIALPGETVLSGVPKNQLLGDEMEESRTEIVLPTVLNEPVSPSRLNKVFQGLQELHGSRPKRIILGIVNDDSTVVYYIVHDGLAKPKKN